MEANVFDPLLAILFVVVGVLSFVLPLVALDRWFTWGALAKRFYSPVFPTGRARWFVSGKIGWGEYSFGLLVAADESGLSLAWGLPFLHSRALLVSWSELEIEERPSRLPWGPTRTHLRFPSVPGATVELYGRWEDTFRRASQGQLAAATS